MFIILTGLDVAVMGAVIPSIISAAAVSSTVLNADARGGEVLSPFKPGRSTTDQEGITGEAMAAGVSGGRHRGLNWVPHACHDATTYGSESAYVLAILGRNAMC